MVPRTFPSTYASNGQQQMLVHFLTSVTGLQRWLDYIPVKLSEGGTENSYNNNGYIDIAVTPITSVSVPFKDYVPVYADSAATDAWQVNSVGFIPYGYALFSDASMILDFTNGSSLDPRITFSRASNATVAGPDGTLQYAPHNLLTFSEQFDSWTLLNSSIVSNTASAPNGTLTAERLVNNSGVTGSGGFGGNGIYRNSATLDQGPVTFSVYAKASGKTVAGLSIAASQFGVAGAVATFDLSTLVVTPNANCTASMVDVGDGWYRCSLTTNTGPTSAVAPRCYLFNPETGDGAAGVLFWGAQVNLASMVNGVTADHSTYYPTTVKNLLGFTQEFDNAAWSKTNGVITANASSAPNGTTTADLFVPSSGSTASGIGSSNIAQPKNLVHTCSVFIKSAGVSFAYVQLNAYSGNNVRCFINLSTGETSLLSSGNGSLVSGSSAAQNVGDGWWRLSFSGIPNTVDSAAGMQWSVNPASSLSSTSYTGDGTSGLYIWGAQLSDSASLDPYVYNPGAAPTSTAYYGPRFDYDPVTLAPRGLLVEEQRTNSIRNNTMQGAVAGTPGTLPTNWQQSVVSGLSFNIAGVGVESGINYVDLRISGTATGTSASSIQFTQNSEVSASAGQTWTLSAFVKVVAGSTSGLSLIRSGWEERSGSFLGTTFIAFTPQSGGNLIAGRVQATAAISNASTTFIKPLINVTPINGATIDLTLRIGMPQLELGAFATSVIPTTTAAATRAADVAVMTGANFSNWFNATEGTFYLDADMYAAQSTSFRYLLGANVTSGSANDFIGFSVPSNGNNLRFAVTSGGTQQAAPQVSLTNDQPFKASGAYKVNDFAVSFNGASALTDTSGTVPTGINRLYLGTFLDSGVQANGSTHIRRIAYFPRRLSNAELQAITS
jgi:hypothetical protein